MRLTENKIIYDNCILYQVARLNKYSCKEEFGGYIEKRLFDQLDTESWIAANSYIYRCPAISGRIYLRSNSIINDSILNGQFFIEENVTISGCNIRTRYYKCIIDKDCKIYNQHFVATGLYDAKLFNDEYFEYKCNDTIDLIMTKHYCRVFCLTMTYTEAWEYLHDEGQWQKMQHKHQNTTPFQLFTPEIKNWLLEQCLIGLNKLRQG